MTTPTFTKGIGRLAVDRYDFQSHLEGINPPGFTDFRHTADQVDIANPALLYGNPTTVEQALEDVNSFIISQTGNGQGFITVGDGFNTYHAANGTINFDPSIPALDTLLNPIFNDIINNVSLPANYARIQHGGIVVIKAGTYIVINTINVPPGITLLGEGYGTKIVNASALNLPLVSGIAPTPLLPYQIVAATATTPIQITVSAPEALTTGSTVTITGVNGLSGANGQFTVTVVDSTHFTLNNSVGTGIYTSGGLVYTQRPIFNIAADTNRSSNDAAIDPNLFMFGRETRIMNMVISDNFVEPTVLGDTFYKLPQNKGISSFSTNPVVPLILQELGSNLVLDGVFGTGRVSFSSGLIVSSITDCFVNSYNAVTPSGGTLLKVNNCFIDAFADPFIFDGYGGSADFMNISGSKIRAYGYLLGDNSSLSANCFIKTTDCNMQLNNNHFFGNDINMQAVVDFTAVSGGSPGLQARSKVVTSNNNIVVAKNNGLAAGTSNNTFQLFASDVPGSIYNYITVAGRPIVVNTVSFIMDSITPLEPYSTILLVDTTSNAVTLHLPLNVEDGQSVTIKDYKGNAVINNITVQPPGGAMIEGVAGNKIFSTNFGSWTLVAFGGSWYMV